MPPFFVSKRVDKDKSGTIKERWVGPCPFIAWAEFDDMLNGLGVDSTGQAAGSFALVEAGCVGANKGMACDKADYSGGSPS